MFQAVAAGDFRMKGVDFLTFGFDQTCNLSCPSCRTHRIVEKTSASIEKARAVEEKLVDLLPTVKVLHMLRPFVVLMAGNEVRDPYKD